MRRPGRLVFFIDDNIVSDLEAAKELARALIPLKLRWVSQASINVAFDDEALALLKRSGCQGLLVGFESLHAPTLRRMRKGFNAAHGGPPAALARFRAHGLRIYGTFIFGYDHDSEATFDETVEFAEEQGLFIAAFNHITPFPGTPLYDRLAAEGRLLSEAWWLDERYRYGMVPFRPKSLSPERLAELCIAARKRFYGWPEDSDFLVPDDVYEHFADGIGARGQKAREELNEILGRQVHLFLTVKVDSKWQDSRDLYAQLGLDLDD